MSNGFKVTALIASGGLGVRMNMGTAKPLLAVAGKPVLVHTLEVLDQHPLIDEIILVFNKEGLEEARALVKKYGIKKVSRVIAGGQTRKDSVRNGLEVVDSKTRLVAIHDGVRPFIDKDSITRVIEAARETGAAVLGVPVKSTIKKVSRDLIVDLTLKRDCLWEIQTPQVFDRELVQKAYLRANKTSVPDDSTLVELMGKKVKIVMGSYFNIKITTQEDLLFAEAIAEMRKLNV
ncbi:MAG TPA: 2-C-methyl-D-erythritol 4-phosphate cytidylyltransferase [Candidatus Omnitrophota bacterium]|nr:2-C-methyl-D-erythritol 4-phosphate cytidylyltransferase [Candidatus Omnitrophota bacterium]